MTSTTQGTTRRAFVLRTGALASSAALTAACGTDAPGSGASGAAPAPQAASGTVQWFMRANAAELAWQQAAIAAFKQTTPAVTVNLETVPTSGEFDPKLTALVAGGTPPDLWTHWGQSGFGDYFAKGMIGEIQSYVARDKLDMNQYFANVHEAWKRDGKLHGLSFNQRFATFIYYNKQLFQQAGLKLPPVDWEDRTWTWDAMVEAARKLTNPGGSVWGFAAGAQPRYWGFAYQFGGDFFTKEHYQKGAARQSNIGSPEVQAAMQAQADLITKLRVWPSSADAASVGITASANRNMFARGHLAMLFDTGSEWPSIDKDATVEWGIAAAPRQKDNKVINFINPLMMSKDSKNKEATWAFIKFNTTEPGQRVLVEKSFQPVIKSQLEPWLSTAKTLKQPVADVRKAVEGAAPHQQISPNQIFVEFGPVRSEVEKGFNPAWAGERSVPEAIAETKTKVDALLADSYARYGAK